jgi:hypothetical protein
MFFGQIMPPKENRKVNIASKKKRMILPHRVKQVAKHAHTSAVESPIDDNATTPGQPNARHDDAELSDAGRQRSSPIVMVPTPGFVLQNTVASSPSPIIDPSPLAQLTTSISSRCWNRMIQLFLWMHVVVMIGCKGHNHPTVRMRRHLMESHTFFPMVKGK